MGPTKFGSNKIWAQQIVKFPKKFGPAKIGLKTFLVSNNCWFKKFGSEKYLGPKKLYSKKYGSHKNIGPTKCQFRKNYVKKVWV